MTKLIVTPIDYSAPGSYILRRRVLRAGKMINDAFAKDPPDGMAAIDAAVQIDDIVLDRVRTGDGSPLEDALDEISADDFDALLGALLTAVVPTKSASSSKSGEPEQEASSQNG